MVDFAELMENKEFTDKLDKIDSTDAILALFAEYGVNITEDELKESYEYYKAQKNGELDADDLDNVSGGAAWSKIWSGIKAIDSVYDYVEKKTGIFAKWNKYING